MLQAHISGLTDEVTILKCKQWFDRDGSDVGARAKGIYGPPRCSKLVKWKTVCQPKCNGGFGLIKLRQTNEAALLMKLGWGILLKPNALWVRVCRSKKYVKESINRESSYGID